MEELLRPESFAQLPKGRITSKTDCSKPFLARNPKKVKLSLEPGCSLSVLVLHTEAHAMQMDVELSEGASCRILDVYTSAAFSQVSVHQHGQSRCEISSVVLAQANASYEIELLGAKAHSELYGTFLVTRRDTARVSVHTLHKVPDCTSLSQVKGVASGNATGEFDGLVHVFADAQHTDARQLSRNICLDKARILSQPQLEIYADDVKCSHGSTVGKLDEEAVLYMRQRGLSLPDAQRLQIEGFVKDVLMHNAIEEAVEYVSACIDRKLTEI